MFCWIDVDGSGEIDRDELKSAVSQLGVHMRELEVDNLFEICDPDKSGSIDIKVLLVWVVIAMRKLKRREFPFPGSHFCFASLKNPMHAYVKEFKDWYLSTADNWVTKRRRDASDTLRDSSLLVRESIRFHPRMIGCCEAFWKVWYRSSPHHTAESIILSPCSHLFLSFICVATLIINLQIGIKNSNA